MDVVEPLLSLTQALRRANTLEDMLYATTDATAALLEVERVTLRLLDETRSRLMLAARTGSPIHAGEVSFAVGEGLSGWVAEHGLSLHVDDAERDQRFVALPGQEHAIGSYLGVPLLDDGGCIGVLSATHDERGRLNHRARDLAVLVAGIAAPWLQAARLRRLALVDPLTSTLNRRGLDATFPRALEGTTPCVLVADIDRFKLVNDTYGHAAGDRVLRAVAATLAETARHADDVVRLGGEEFLIVLRGASIGAGARVAERSRAAIAALRVPDDRGEPIRVTASIGVALQRPGESRDALIERADAAMYRAKDLGRDRVELDSDEQPFAEAAISAR